MYSISYKNRHNLSVTIMILPKAMHINGIFLNVTKLKVTATMKSYKRETGYDLG